MADFSLVAHVDVDQTGGNGERNAGSSAWSWVDAPNEHVINKDKVQFAFTHDATEPRFDVVWDNLTEVIPGTGIEQPRKLLVRVHCLSKHGRYSGGAWADLKATGDFVKYVKK